LLTVLPVGTIVSTRGRCGDNMTEKATFARTWSMPLVVLIDGDSASASEIFAAAIQENRRGVVVGAEVVRQGFGYTHFPLSSMSGDLRINKLPCSIHRTVGRWRVQESNTN
jgi:carboxyl-terminal processing protease